MDGLPVSPSHSGDRTHPTKDPYSALHPVHCFFLPPHAALVEFLGSPVFQSTPVVPAFFPSPKIVPSFFHAAPTFPCLLTSTRSQALFPTGTQRTACSSRRIFGFAFRRFFGPSLRVASPSPIFWKQTATNSSQEGTEPFLEVFFQPTFFRRFATRTGSRAFFYTTLFDLQPLTAVGGSAFVC